MSQPESSKSLSSLGPGPPGVCTQQSLTACSGSPSPCNPCIRAGTENDCHFDPRRDLRRKVTANGRYKNSPMTKFCSIFCEAPFIEELTALIRRNGSMREIALALGSPVTEFSELRALSTPGHLALSEEEHRHLESPHFAEFETKARRSSKLSRIPNAPEENIEPSNCVMYPYALVTLESLCDIPRFKVSENPWTEVTDDSDLVSHLVSLYFTWDHPCLQFVDQGIFVDHMERENLDSEFCTPLLVNSLLSVASTYSDGADVIFDAKSAFSRGDSFFQAAERLWRAQNGRPTLPNIQTLLLMCSVYVSALYCISIHFGKVKAEQKRKLSFQGNNSLRWLTLRQAVQLGQDIGLFCCRERHFRPVKLCRQRWSVHNGGSADFDRSPYPRSNQITFATKLPHLPKIRQGLAELTEIMVHVQELLYDDKPLISFGTLFAQVEIPYNRL
ncbi:transcriptional regulator family: Fungal Specific TF [Penicillium citrinum]|uniref:Transcriptional regulator family: Fungal Specific TF n=1 Tax=Penicillium citrinum TaxID=5077 RepID=A0A9W9PBZ8_PENCI|nr:transcriptional regulator family: Fungal Specific TF [Penicillium citrinum]KAJ5240448.1 transcriptional regulator family: Fungal Specific TF [Penicillium citrinum]